MVDRHAALRQDFFEITVRHTVPHVEKSGMQDHVLRKLSTFERHHLTDLIGKSRCLIDHHAKVCDRTRMSDIKKILSFII